MRPTVFNKDNREWYGNDCRKIGADYYCDDKNYWLMPEGD